MKYGLGAVAAIVVVAAVVIAVASSSGSSGEGEQAQDFNFSLFQGIEEVGFREGNFASLQGKPVILNFWAGLCPPCRAEMPQFQLFYEEFKDEVLLLGIDIGVFTGLGSRSDAEALLRELGVTYPAGWTEDGSVPRKYGVTAMPTTVFISSDGTIFERGVGAIDANFLARASREMLAAEAEAAAGTTQGG
jgi:thiol-disulfide isomerase/thioredoxin